MKGPAPREGAGNRGCGAGQSAQHRGPRGCNGRTRANRALMEGKCARDPPLYGRAMETQLSRYAGVGGLFRPLGHHPNRDMLQGGAGPSVAVGCGRGFLRRLVRATTRRRVRRGAARSLNVSGRTGGEARRNSGGRSERASHHGTMREASLSNIVPVAHAEILEGIRHAPAFFGQKPDNARHHGLTCFASPCVSWPAAPRLLSSSPCAGRPNGANGTN